MDKFNVFLHFLTENIDQYISTADKGLAFMESVIVCIDRADCEKGTELFYQGSNKDLFLQQLILIQEFSEIGNFGTIPPEVSINYLLQEINAVNWEENQQYSDEKCHYQIEENKHGHQNIITDFPDGLKEIYQRKIADNQSKYILLNLYNEFIYNDIKITICKICNNIPPDCQDVFYAKNFKELDQWLDKNRKPRNFSFEDYRHIETHPKYDRGNKNRPPKSPLLGGLGGQQHAANLLKDALEDKRERPNRLYNFDEKYKRYIQFEYEGDNPQNQYHGYHLVKPTTHEPDKKAVNDIPQRVVKILEYRQRNML